MILDKKELKKSLAEVGTWTLISRLIGFGQDFFMARFFGASAISDAFFISFRLPNLLRRIFADGAMSASLVPSVISMMSKNETDRINRLSTFSLFFFMTLMTIFSLIVYFYPLKVIFLIAPGLKPEQLEGIRVVLPIMFPFIIFLSGCAVFSSTLKTINHFFITAVGPTIFIPS